MVIEEFMDKLVKYYGEYENPSVYSSVKGYVIENIKESEYLNLSRTIMYYHKVIFKSPCIATIEECIEKARLKKEKFAPYKSRETKNCDAYRSGKQVKDYIDPEYFRKLKEKVKIKNK